MQAKSIIQLLHGVPRAAALIDANDSRILDCNTAFITLAGDGTGQNALDFLSHGQHKAPLFHVLGGIKPGWRGGEITLDLLGKLTLCWCEVHSLIAKESLVHFLEIHEMEQLRALEAAYLHRIRRVADDNLWIIDDAGVLLWVRSENPAFAGHIDRKAYDLVMLEDRAVWDTSFRNAKSTPGSTVECTVRSSMDGKSRFIDICYLAGGLFGGRYYVASRSTEPSGCRVVRRLKEAWGCRDDKDLAGHLNTSKAAISRANKEETVPPGWIIKTGEGTGFSLDWLLTGQGEKRRI